MTHAVNTPNSATIHLHTGSTLRADTNHPLTPEFNRELSNALIKHDGAMLFLSIDRYPELSTNLGAQASNRILNRVLESIQDQIRTSDASCRYHNNIVVMLANTNIQSAHRVADRMRENMANMTFWLDKEQHRITVSIGYTGVNKEDDRDSIMARADLWLSDQAQPEHNLRQETPYGNCLMHLCA